MLEVMMSSHKKKETQGITQHINKIKQYTYTIIVDHGNSNGTHSFQINLLSMILFILFLLFISISSIFLIKNYPDQKELSEESLLQLKENQKGLDSILDIISNIEESKNLLTASLYNIQKQLNKNLDSQIAPFTPQNKNVILLFSKMGGKKQEEQIRQDLRQLNEVIQGGTILLNRVSNTEFITRNVLKELPTLWPIKGQAGYITGRFGCENDSFTNNPYIHLGMDFGYGYGIPIVSAANGTVLETGYSRNNYGNYVLIGHRYGYKTKYGHLQNTFVKPGDRVKQGQVIGTMGNTGKSTGPHLHFGIIQGNIILDPQIFIGITNDVSVVR